MLLYASGLLGPFSAWPMAPYAPQYADPVTEPWRWHRYAPLDGQGVLCLAEAPDHSVWFGVKKGVYQYDGLHWKLHQPEDGLAGAPVIALTCDADGSVYTGSFEGISRFKAGRWQRLFPRRPADKEFVNVLRVAPDGSLWAALRFGLLHWTESRLTLYVGDRRDLPPGKEGWFDDIQVIVPERQQAANQLDLDENGLSDPPEVKRRARADAPTFLGAMKEICPAARGTVWFLSPRLELLSCQSAPRDTSARLAWKLVSLNDPGLVPLKEHEAGGLIEDRNGMVWVVAGNHGNGVGRYDPGRNVFQNSFLGDLFGGEDRYTSIVETADGSLWIAGHYRLFKSSQGVWSVYSTPAAPIPPSRWINLMAGSDGSLWLAGLFNEVVRLELSRTKWATFEGLNFQCETPDGSLWFLAANNRIIRQERDRWRSYGVEDGLLDAPAAVLATRAGRVWVAGSDHRVAAAAVWDGVKWTTFTHPRLSWGMDSRSLFEAADGTVWFGAAGDSPPESGYLEGLLVYHPAPPDQESYWEFKWPDPRTGRKSWGIGETADGVIWIGGALKRYAHGSFQSISSPEELGYDDVDAVHSTPEGHLWLGTRNHGLFDYAAGQWTKHSRENGLDSNAIIDVLPATNGLVWVATDKGISRFDGQTWDNRVFDRQMNLGREGGSLRQSSDGALWINQTDFRWKTRARPDTARQAEKPVAIRAFRYQPRREAPDTTITFAMTQVPQPGNVFLAWDGVDRWNDTAAEDMEFSFRLDGEPWSPWSPRKDRYFLRLRDGSHVFEVRSANRDRHADPHPARIVFAVLAPAWKQPRFLLPFLFLLGTVAFLAVRLVRAREQRLTQTLAFEKRQVETRLRIFTNLSHELRTPLTLILGPLEKLARLAPSAAARDMVQLMDRNGQRLLRLVNQLLDMRLLQEGKLKLDPTPGDLALFTAGVAELFRPRAHEKGIQLSFEASPPRLPTRFDKDKVEKIVSNLLSNAVKYTPAGGRIRVSLAASNAEIILTVEDTGRGIPAPNLPRIFEDFYRGEGTHVTEGAGIGLALVKELAQLHGGTISVESPVIAGSKTSPGSRFVLRLPRLSSEEKVT